jgi:hypothetical protein
MATNRTFTMMLNPDAVANGHQAVLAKIANAPEFQYFLYN